MKVAIMATGVTEAAADAALTTAFSLGSSDVDVVLSTEDESIAAANGMLMSMMVIGQTLVAAVADVVMIELDAYWYHDSSASINKAVANQLKLGIDTPTTLKNWNWLNARLVEAITDFDELSNTTAASRADVLATVGCATTLLHDAIDFAFRLTSDASLATTAEAELELLYKLTDLTLAQTSADVYNMMTGLLPPDAESPTSPCFAGRPTIDEMALERILPVFGCTDSIANGFSLEADTPDGSCDYSAVYFVRVMESSYFSLQFSVFDEESSASSIRLVVDVEEGDSRDIFPCLPDAEFGSKDCPCIQQTGSAEQRVVTFLPTPTRFGSAVMKLGITDGVAPPASFKTAEGAYDWMVVDVQNIPDLPFFDPSDAQTVYKGSMKVIYVRVEDTDTPIDEVVVWAVSANNTILNNRFITSEGFDAVRKLTVRVPADNVAGSTSVRVYADDGRAFYEAAGESNYGVMTFDLTIKDAPTIDPTQCWATGTGLEYAVAGGQASFTVYTVDFSGDIQGAGADVTIEQYGPGTISFGSTALDDGILRFTYVPTVRGFYQIAIRQAGEKIRHGSFTLYVDHAEMSQQNSVFVSATEANAGSGLNITVQTRDAFDNDHTGVDDNWALRLWDGYQLVEDTLIALGDGVYQYTTTPNLAGNYVAYVSTLGETLGQGPLQIRVWPGPTDPASCRATGAGTSFGIQEELLTFTVATVDHYGNPKIRGGEVFSMVFSGAGTVYDINNAEIDYYVDNMDGTYTVTYMCPESGLYSVGMRLATDPTIPAQHIRGSPFEVFIDISQNTDPASTVNTYAYDCGVDPLCSSPPHVYVAGVEEQFRIQAVDDRNEKKGIGGDNFRVQVTGTTGDPATRLMLSFPCTDYNIGIYYCKYTWEKAEPIDIMVSLKGIENIDAFLPIQGGDDYPASPYQVTVVPGAIAASNCIAVGSALTTLTAGVEGVVTVSVWDAYNNEVVPNIGQRAAFVATVVDKLDISTSFPGTITPGEGNQIIIKYVVPLAPSHDGFDYLVEITSLGEDLRCNPTGNPGLDPDGNAYETSCPSQLTVPPDELDAAQSYAEGDAIDEDGYTVAQRLGEAPSIAQAGITSYVTVYARDQFENLRAQGGDSFSASLQNAEGDVPLQVDDNNDGTYTVQYNTQASGSALLTILILGIPAFPDGVALGGDGAPPFEVQVTFGQPDPASITATGSGIQASCTAGDELTITLMMFDAFGNRVETGGADVQLSVKSPSTNQTAVVTIEDTDNGRYELSYTPTQADTYDLVGTIAGEQIASVTLTDPSDPASQRQIVVGYAATFPAKCVITPAVLPAPTCGQPNSFTLQSTDAYGNPRLEDSDKIIMTRADGSTDLEIISTTYEGSGLYRVTWSITKIPTSKVRWLNVKTGDASLPDDSSSLLPILGSPFSSDVLPGGISPDSIEVDATAAGLVSPTAGSNATFGISAKDEFDNVLTGNVPGLEVNVIGRSGEGTLVGIIEQDPDDTSRLRGRYMPEKVGQYDARVTVAGVLITQTLQPLVVRAGQIAPGSCRASGGGITNGKPGELSVFTISARDTFSNLVTDSIRARDYLNMGAGRRVGFSSENPQQLNLIQEPVQPTARQSDRSVDSTFVIKMWGCGKSMATETKSSTCPDGRDSEGVPDGSPDFCDYDNPVVSIDGATGVVTYDRNLFDSFAFTWEVGSSTYTVEYTLTVATADNYLRYEEVDGQSVPTNEQYYKIDITVDQWSADHTATSAGDTTGEFISSSLIGGGSRCFYGGTIVGQKPFMYGPALLGNEAGPVRFFIQDVNQFPVTLSNQFVRIPRVETTTAICPDQGATDFERDCNQNVPADTCRIGEDCWNDWSFTVSMVSEDMSVDAIAVTRCLELPADEATAQCVNYADPTGSSSCIDVYPDSRFDVKNYFMADENPRDTPYECNMETQQWPSTPLEAVYYVDFMVPNVGDYTVFAISTTGAAVDGTGVFSVSIIAAALDPATCEVSGAGRSAATAGTSASIAIQGKDTYGNARTSGGTLFALATTGAVLQDSQVTDNGDGTYTGTYTVTELQTYNSEDRDYAKMLLEVTLQSPSIDGQDVGAAGDPVGASPFEVFPQPGPGYADNTELVVGGNDFVDGLAGVRYPVDIVLADQYGNKKIVGGDTVEFQAPQGSTLQQETTDNADGTYAVRYMFTRSGSTELTVSVNGDTVAGIARTVVTSPAEADGSHCTLAPASMPEMGRELTAGEITSFEILVFDTFDNRVTDLDAEYDVGVRIYNDDASCSQCATIAKKEGGTDGQLAYTVTYGATEPPAAGERARVDQTSGEDPAGGQISLAVTLATVAIADSPFVKNMLPAVASVSDTTASGPGITYMIAGQTMNFDIEARDIYGNVAAAIRADGTQLTFAVEIVGATTLSTINGLVTVGSQVDGKFPVSYTGPTETGEYTISIDSAGAPIFGSPFEGIICDTTTDAGWVRAESQGGVFTASNGDEQWFTLKAYGGAESNGAKKLVGGDIFLLELTGATLVADAADPDDIGYRIDDSNDGEYRVYYTAFANIPFGETSVDFSISVKLQNNEGQIIEIGGNEPNGLAPRSPFPASISAGRMSTQSATSGDGLNAAVAGIDAVFSVTCMDWWGNLRADIDSAGLFKASLESQTPGPRIDNSTFEAITFDLVPAGDGAYTGTYNVRIAGTYTLTIESPTAVNLDDALSTTLASSPTTVVVSPAQSNAANSMWSWVGDEVATVAGEQGEFRIQGVDEFGNYAIDTLSSGPDGFSATLPTETAINIANTGPGTHTGTFAESAAGDFPLTILLTFGEESSPVAASPYQLSVTPAGLSVAHCYATGAGTLRPAAGDEALFYVQSRDRYLNARGGVDDQFEFQMFLQASDTVQHRWKGRGAVRHGPVQPGCGELWAQGVHTAGRRSVPRQLHGVSQRAAPAVRQEPVHPRWVGRRRHRQRTSCDRPGAEVEPVHR